jgi:PTH1 family peptidyl-tRNA hydrolase
LQDAVFQDQKIVLAAPQTFMNLSGRSIQQVVQFYQIPFGDILVVCDDMNLKLGQLRLRPTGSAGGQKGLQSILQVCGTEGIPRLRIGVGRPPEQMDVSAYVLSKFRKDEVPQIDNSIRNAASGIEIWIRDGTAAAMNVMNPLLTDPKDGHPRDGQGEGKKK